MTLEKLVLGFGLAVGVALAGCTNSRDSTPEPTEDMCDTGETYVYVVSVLDIGQPEPDGDPNVVPGFDLDGIESAADDALGCYHADWEWPAGTKGIDNQLGPIVTGLGSAFDVTGSIQENIAEGDLLMVMEVRHVDSLVDDECVEVSFLMGVLPEGVAMPALGADGLLLPGQTFDVDTRSYETGTTMAQANVEGSIAARKLSAGPVDLEVNIPVEEDALTLSIRDAKLGFEITAGGLSDGLIGGALDVDETTVAIMMFSDEVPQDLVAALLEANADLNPDADGVCQAVSVGLIFDATTGTRGVDRVPEAPPAGT